jgi:hypothetical protein
MIKKIFFAVLLVSCFYIHAQDLSISTDDVRIELRADGGFHMFIRKKPEIASVLITESTRDPLLQSDNYAYRAGEWNSINGNEIRVINGVPIPRESRIYSLVSSTPVNHNEFGQAFHIYIPYVLYYGYEEGRYGEVFVTHGTYLNIRAFEFPYADYRGYFRDNPFILEATQIPAANVQSGIPVPEGNYLKETIDAFTEIADTGGGDLIFASDPDDVTEKIRSVLENEKNKNIDIVLCLDTTGSMRKYIDSLRLKLIPMLNEIIDSYPSYRIGLVLFKDYNEEYLTRVIPFTNDFTRFQRELNSVRAGGGGDIPEAVYEALYDGAEKFPWEAESRIMILVGDAPPHPRPRGRITKDMVFKAVEEKEINVSVIILPL